MQAINRGCIEMLRELIEMMVHPRRKPGTMYQENGYMAKKYCTKSIYAFEEKARKPLRLNALRKK